AYSAVLAALISLPIGFAAGLRSGRVVDQASRVFFTVSFAMPAFWLGIILILIFSVHLPVFPISGFGSGLIGHLYYLFLPALTIVGINLLTDVVQAALDPRVGQEIGA